MLTKQNSSLYQGLAENIKEYIARHALLPGDRIPSVMQLCSLFGVSHTTVRAALKVLTDEGVLESRHRQGVFVSTPREEKPALESRNMIAILVPNGDHSYEAGIIRGVTEQSHSAGFNVIIANSNDNAAKEAAQLSELSRQVAGLIVFPSIEGGNYATYAKLLERSVPWVFVDRSIAGLSAPLVATDNEYGGYIATRHLLEQGCRHVYALNANLATSTQERLQGHRRALKEWGISNPQLFVRHSSEHNHTVGYTFTQEILKHKAPGERIGILALDEYLARTCYTALKDASQRIPEDVAVVTYDDISAMFFEPPLTAVRQETYQMGATAVQVLLDMIRYKKTASREVRLKPELMIRNSTDTHSLFSWTAHRAEKTVDKFVASSIDSSGDARPVLTAATL
jgi:DNA-binding LacI/PurR family transcriptional regulator